MGSVPATSLPSKIREVQNHHQDSTIWNTFPFRSDDIVISTYAKSGTTWTQQIVSQLVHGADPSANPGIESPWVEFRLVPQPDMKAMLAAQTHRRYMKTHLPADAIVWRPDVKYIFIGRDGRDMIWSLHNHFDIAKPEFWAALNDTPGRVGPALAHPPENPRDLFLDFLQDDTSPAIAWPFWSHIRGWWEVRNLPNVLMVHFADMKKDLEGEMKRIQQFLQTPDMEPEQWKAAVEHCTFQWMKEHSETALPPGADIFFAGGTKGFIHKGTNGRWTDSLTEEDCRRYDEKAREELGKECAEWLEKGGRIEP